MHGNNFKKKNYDSKLYHAGLETLLRTLSPCSRHSPNRPTLFLENYLTIANAAGARAPSQV